MKQKMILTVCLAVLGLLGVKAQIAIMALHHQGQVKIYSYADVPNILNDAVDGDTIYLSEGIFPSDFTITKKITIIGSGMETIIKGKVSIAIPDSVTLTARTLQNIDIQNDISIDKPVDGFSISQCKFINFLFNANVSNCQFDRVYCTNSFYINSYSMKDTHVYSSKIKYIHGSGQKDDKITFDHCNISGSYYETKGTCINCIIKIDNWSSNRLVYQNCLWGGISDPEITLNCWRIYDMTFDDELNVTEPTDISQYIGTDGTVVGITGSSIPFTLTPAMPKVLEHSLEVNEVGTELKVTLKVGKK